MAVRITVVTYLVRNQSEGASKTIHLATANALRKTAGVEMTAQLCFASTIALDTVNATKMDYVNVMKDGMVWTVV